MSGLYNVLFGMNSATYLVAPMLTDEDPTSYFPRFRDCYVEDGHIVIYTRVGGDNRFESHGNPDWDFGESKLYELPTFITTYDDGFDSTYGYYVFGVPDEWQDDFDRIMACDLGALSDAYVERIAGCFGIDACKLRETLDQMEIDSKSLEDAPSWDAFFDALKGGAE